MADEQEAPAPAPAAELPERANERIQTLIGEKKSLAQQLEIWKRLVREGGLQQYPRHLDDVLEDLGPMPSYEQPSRLALWAAALVNPLPGLGVAPEIRPLLMRCNSARQRLKVAKAGVDASIRSLEALKNSWWRRAFRVHRRRRSRRRCTCAARGQRRRPSV